MVTPGFLIGQNCLQHHRHVSPYEVIKQIKIGVLSQFQLSFKESSSTIQSLTTGEVEGSPNKHSRIERFFSSINDVSR